MRYLYADKIHNGFSFLPAGSVLVMQDDGTVENILSAAQVDSGKLEKHAGILCPGLVNTHCHLELAYLKGKLSEGAGLHAFISEIERLKKPADEAVHQAIAEADAEMAAGGIAVVGDICNTSSTFELKRESAIVYHNFIEVYAFDPARAAAAFEKGLALAEKALSLGLFNFSITPHAPYSASPQLLKRLCNYAWEMDFPLSIHNQENADEDVLFKTGRGKIMDRLTQFGIDTSSFSPSGKSSLQSILPFFPIDRNLLLVHNTFTAKDDVWYATTYSRRIWWCICACANEFIERSQPDISMLAELGKGRITLGTDSYASNHQLSLAAEMSAIKRENPAVQLEELIRWATYNGAEYLGMEDRYGSFQKGKKPGITRLYEEKDGQLVSQKI